jgi:hypothetical protein
MKPLPRQLLRLDKCPDWDAWFLRLYRIQPKVDSPAIAKIITPEVAPTSVRRGFILFTLAISWLCSVALQRGLIDEKLLVLLSDQSTAVKEQKRIPVTTPTRSISIPSP